MKIDRLIGIITLLLQKEQVTAPELARRFEVSRRTINRDIEDICKAGIPLMTTQGYGGGISIAPGYKIDQTVLTKDELQSILGSLKGLDSISAASYTQNLSEKLFKNSNDVIAADNYFLIDLASHYKGSLTFKIELIKKAITDKKVIEFDYFYKQGDDHRLIEPYFIVFKWSSWYVYGYCLKRSDFRLFKLNRLWSLYQTGQTFTTRESASENLDFDNHYKDNIFFKGLFDPGMKHRLIDEYGPECFTLTKTGQLLVELSFTHSEELLHWILSFGAAAEVLEPKELAEEICRHAKNILQKYHDINQT